MGNFCQLTSGGIYDFETKKLEGRYSLEADLIYPLAGIPHFGKHSLSDWNVAIHSVAVGICIGDFLRSHDCEPTDVLDGTAAGLLHDAHEAVIGDITTPVAWEIGYDKAKEVKAGVQLAIEERLGVSAKRRPTGWKQHVKDADAAALHVERQLFMAPCERDWGLQPPGPEWMQPMHNIITSLVREGHHKDGGAAAFLSLYGQTVAR